MSRSHAKIRRQLLELPIAVSIPITCQLCERAVPADLITLHHLLPRQKGGQASDRTPLCRTCHKQIHATFSNSQLAKSFAQIELLRTAPQLTAFLGWIKRQRADRTFQTTISGAHPHARRRR